MNSKTIILSVLLLSFFMTTDAQEETISNPYSVGGLINFNINTFVPTSTPSFGVSPSYSFLINPYFGKIIKENLFLGLELDYNKRELDLPSSSMSSHTQYGVGLFLRYFLNPDKRFNIYFQPNVKFVTLSQGSKQITNSFLVGVGAGMLYNINNKWRVLARLGGIHFVTGKWKNTDTGLSDNFSTFATNISLSNILFGFEYRL